ncbi:MerR family transcriptional regulator [Pandoraea sputorum]|uniref:Uncharacterized protein n=1 Tax=Pandoraea sputorum TaxID=93222 RepID=A0A5E5BJX3_9BURK|nr:hypothetical protein [Pandoraea sputorum]VVE86004.1 hypothetical protein PSP31121_05643 [Pandoraea sputorum]
MKMGALSSPTGVSLSMLRDRERRVAHAGRVAPAQRGASGYRDHVEGEVALRATMVGPNTLGLALATLHSGLRCGGFDADASPTRATPALPITTPRNGPP